MLNKKGWFGGLWLSCVIAVFSFSTNLFAYNPFQDLRQVRNNLNQIYWRIIANNTVLETPGKGQNSWIKKSIYDTSIKKVIGKAIGDCVTSENEFQGKESGGVVTFEVSPINLEYSIANWNAVVLYNLVEYVKRSVRYGNCKRNNTVYAIPEGFEKYEKVTFEQIKEDLIAHYTTLYQNAGYANKVSELKESIGLAISDIKKYDSALKLVSTLEKVMQTAYQYDCLDTRLWRIKTLRDISKRAQNWLDYGKNMFSTAEKYVQKLQKFAEDSSQKIKDENKKDEKSKQLWKYQNGTKTWPQLIESCKSTSKELTQGWKKNQIDKLQQSLNEFITEQKLDQKDEDLYNDNLINDEVIVEVANILSDIISKLESLYKEDVFSYVNGCYTFAESYSKECICVELSVKPLDFESFKQPDNSDANDLMQARTLHLAPELKQIQDEGRPRAWCLFLNQKIKSPFSANQNYIQESNLVFDIDPSFQKTPALDYIKTTIPVRKATGSNKLNNKQLIKYDTDRKGPKYGVLDNREKLEVAYCSRRDYDDIKFKAEDPILGNIVAMIEDLIDELHWKKKARQRME